MYLAPILTLIIIRFLRKSLQTAVLLPRWDRLLLIGMFSAIAILVIGSTVRASEPILLWTGYLLLLALVSLPFYEPAFRPARPIVYAAMPLIFVELASDITELASPNFYETWNDYFDTAGLFAIIWMIAMLIINKKQRTALQKERLRAQEIERESKITESLKAALEVQVAERTAALTSQKEALQHTLDELRTTQAQLVQSEKMASLGELTAGIAHEIQNPLNFVNNFAEVNTELIEELKNEKLKPLPERNVETENQLLDDIAQNLEKINHHGKRADAIVKGMLQHSRSSTGQKEPTDINALADEYLRLAYHGLRAKDKSFNATLNTDFDTTIGSINIIPQDIGRVILNLITNAFYAVTDRKKKSVTSLAEGSAAGIINKAYEPTVTLTTKRIQLPSGGWMAQISVKDNGTGIPAKALGKIFQPFFTTKRTGQGTGLGLSMSFEIITKGHNGELKVITRENEGSEFIINLHI